MGKIEEGILGGFRGKVGTVVGGKWRGINYMRAKGPSKRNNNSQLQLVQQARFALAISFVRRLSTLFDITYKSKAQEQTAANEAMAQTVTKSITGTYPAFTIDYSKVMISRGSLDKPLAPTMTVMAGIIHWQWNFDSQFQGLLAKHRAVLVVYCPAVENSLYTVAGPERSEMAASINVTPFMGQTVYTWMAFISENGKKISDSVFTGQVVVA